MKRSEVKHLLKDTTNRDAAKKILYSFVSKNYYQEMEMDSDLVDTHSDITFVTDAVTPHSHSFYEFIYCVQGCPEYLLGTQRYTIQPGDIIIVPPEMIHCPIFTSSMPMPYERYLVWISTAFIDHLRKAKYPTWSNNQPAVLRIKGTKWGYIERFFKRGIRESEEKAFGWEVSLTANATQMLVHISRAMLEMDQGMLMTPRDDLLEQILDYIQENLAEKITIQQTSRHFHISASTLTHLFHQEMSVSFYRCVTQRRLVEAKAQIARGIPMDKVSRAVGFQEYSAFYRAFKQEFGISPRQFRKNAPSKCEARGASHEELL